MESTNTRDGTDITAGSVGDDVREISDDDHNVTADDNVDDKDDNDDNKVDDKENIAKEDDECINWSFYECVVNGSVRGVERHLAKDSTLVNQPFRLGSIYDICHCWMFFELGFQVDVNMGFYPGSLSWNERAYPDPPRNSERQTSRDSPSMDKVMARLQNFLLNKLETKEIPGVGMLRVCSCSHGSLLDSISQAQCHNLEELDDFLGDPNCPNHLSLTYPLHIAAMLGWRRVMEVLLKNGADPNLHTQTLGLQVVLLCSLHACAVDLPGKPLFLCFSRNSESTFLPES